MWLGKWFYCTPPKSKFLARTLLILQVEFMTHGGLRPLEHWKLTVYPNPEPESLPTTGDDGFPHTTSESVELL